MDPCLSLIHIFQAFRKEQETKRAESDAAYQIQENITSKDVTSTEMDASVLREQRAKEAVSYTHLVPPACGPRRFGSAGFYWLRLRQCWLRLSLWQSGRGPGRRCSLSLIHISKGNLYCAREKLKKSFENPARLGGISCCLHTESVLS